MWGVCSIKPRQIELAITNLARQGYGTFNPIFEKRKLDRRRKLITANEPLFLNYLFVELLDGQRWPPINSTYGINKLLTRTATGSEYVEPASVADSSSTNADRKATRIVAMAADRCAQVTSAITCS